MKKLALLLVVATCAFSSCQKDLYEPKEEPQAPKKMTDLVIPADFTWSMIQKVESKLTSPVATRVAVYSDSKCENKIAEYTIYPEVSDVPIIFEVPSNLKELYVKPEGQAVQAIKIANNAIEQTIIPTTSRAATRAEDDETETNYELYSEWRTIMFEDQFPKLGDYDFNDFVANYKYKATYETKGNGKGKGEVKLKQVVIEIRTNAIGGNLPYTPYVRIGGFNSANSQTEILPEDVERIMKVDGGNKTITLKLNNIGFKPSANQFINTVADEQIQTPEKSTITINFKNSGNLEKKVSLDFDFFLAKEGVEIHKKGKESILYDYPTDKIEGGEGDAPFSNSDNYIWALEIPAVVHHVIEKKSFLEAYPAFTKWAEAGGTSNEAWYNESGISDLIINLSEHWK